MGNMDYILEQIPGEGPEQAPEHKPELEHKLELERRVAQRQEPLQEPELVEENKLGKTDQLSSNLLIELRSNESPLIKSSH